MARHRIKRGLNLPIAGEPEAGVDPAAPPSRVAVLAADFIGMRPTMHVAAGDAVRRGQPLFEDKKTPGVRYTSPASGVVAGVHRGAKRSLQSVVIRLDEAERSGSGDQVSFGSFSGKHPSALNVDDVRELLLESGLWVALRARPFGRVADPEARPHSIFVTAMDSNPLAPQADELLAGGEEDFQRGLLAISKLTEGPVFVCKAPGSAVEAPAEEKFHLEEFAGPHPAGTVGVHIHFLDPVDRNKEVWYIGLQDVVAIGRLFATGELKVERVTSLAGPAVRQPRLLRTRIGAAVDELVSGQLLEGENRVISGSVLSGRAAAGEVLGYLGRYHQQVCALREGRQREFLGWAMPGMDKFSTVRAFASRMIPGKRFAMTTALHGSQRAIVPIGVYERVMPMDLVATALLKALVMGDLEQAERLGCLELEEEDLALCTLVCPGKNDYGPYLRNTLTQIEKEG